MTLPTSPAAAGLVAAQAREALLHGDRAASRRLAFEALGRDPSCDVAWLVLAALSPPARRRSYLEHALTLAPTSPRLRKALTTTLTAAVGQARLPPVGGKEPLTQMPAASLRRGGR